MWYCNNFWSIFFQYSIFRRPFVKQFALCYQTVVCLSYLSVTLVYSSQTVGWINMKLGTHGGLGPGDFVLDGDPAPPPQKGGGAGSGAPQIFGPCLLWSNGWMDEAGTWHGLRPQPR